MFGFRYPDTPTPPGCLSGFLALFPAALAAVAFYGAHTAYAATPPYSDIGRGFLIIGGLALITAVGGLAFAFYKLMTIGKLE